MLEYVLVISQGHLCLFLSINSWTRTSVEIIEDKECLRKVRDALYFPIALF